MQFVILLIRSNDLSNRDSMPSSVARDIERLVPILPGLYKTLYTGSVPANPVAHTTSRCALRRSRIAAANATRRQRLDPLKRAESTHIKEFIRPASDVYRDEVLFAVPGNLTSSCCEALEAQLSAFSNFPDVIFSPHASSPYHFWVYMHPQGLNLLRLGGGSMSGL